MLEKVDALKTDKEMVTKCKNQLQLQLSEYLGSDIPQDTPHIYSGITVRGILYMGTMYWFLPGDFLAEIIYPLFLSRVMVSIHFSSLKLFLFIRSIRF